MEHIDIDEQIAEKLLGWTRLFPSSSIFRTPKGHVATATLTSYSGFQPSTNISDAWKVVKRLQEFGLWVTIQSDNHNFLVTITHEGDELYAHAQESSAPLAICKATLKSLKIDYIAELFNEQKVVDRWEVLEERSPSGKALFQCRQCKRVSTTPDKECPQNCK